MKFNQFIAFILVFIPFIAFSYPKYAVRSHTNKCTVCHVNALGGGPRNLTGKALGLHGNKANKIFQQEQFSMDVRQLYFHPDDANNTPGGSGVMAAVVYANIQLTDDDSPVDLRYVGGYNFGYASSANRSNYIQAQLPQKHSYRFLPEYIQVGRFHTPFGILTDEHRTYTNIQTSSGWNDFENGFLLSADPTPYLHYDIAFTNGVKNATTPNNGAAKQWNNIFNIRRLINSMPAFVGFSFSSHTKTEKDKRTAYSLYSVIDFSSYLDLTLTTEISEATNWNDNISRFVGNSTYLASTEESTSQAALVQFEYDLNENWTLIHKTDYLVLDKNYGGEFYVRSGFGFKYFGPSSLIFQVRYETAKANANAEANSTATGNIGGYIAILQISI